jgi:hypothetical protein
VGMRFLHPTRERRDARHDLELDAGIDERERLLPAPAEDERVAAL